MDQVSHDQINVFEKQEYRSHQLMEEDDNSGNIKMSDLHRIGVIIGVSAVIYFLYYQILFG